MRDFRNYQVWQKAHELTLSVYRLSQGFPTEERFALTTQMRRAACSIPTNVAEGCGRCSDREMAHFLNIAIGSNSELEYQFLLAKDLAYIYEGDYESCTAAVIEIRRMLYSLVKKLKS